MADASEQTELYDVSDRELIFGAILDILDESETSWETPDTDCREAVQISSRCTDLALFSLVGPTVERNGDRGRPRLEIPEDVLISLRSLGLPWTEIARMLLVARWTLRRRVVEYGLQDVTGYSPLTDEQLDNIVTQFKYFNI